MVVGKQRDDRKEPGTRYPLRHDPSGYFLQSGPTSYLPSHPNSAIEVRDLIIQSPLNEGIHHQWTKPLTHEPFGRHKIKAVPQRQLE
jgi:hypothetical protein